jgi:hypothetical protein
MSESDRSEMDEELDALRRAIAARRDEATPELEELARAVDAYRARETEDEDDDGLFERLGEAVDRFEATHPEVSTALARVIDSLTAFGL